MEIIIEGKMTELVIQQLQGIVQDYLLLSINSQSKRLEYTFKNENIEIKDELVNRLKTIIDDKTIHVEISAIELNKCAGGMFLGNNVGLINSDIIYARQAVDPTRLSDIDNYSGEQIGTHLMHEITEAYEGALITKEKKLKGILPADKEKYKKDYKYYLEAHKRASKSTQIREISNYLNENRVIEYEVKNKNQWVKVPFKSIY